ncbi:MAG: hypothetical protein HYT96_04095 [Armatimonadetes bacterium]|nr:hypothetical protein [Armatimonadota bacterium]
MQDAVFIFMGVVFGILAGWYLASRHAHRLASLVEDEKRSSARAVRSAKDQVAAQLERKDHELSHVQSRLDDERRTAETTFSKLQADLARVSDRRERLEKVSSELESRIGELKAELQTATEDSFRELAQFHDVASSLERVLESFTQLIETVESRLLAANQRQRQAISTGSSTAPGPKAVRDEPASPRRTLS